ncbi:hypothetical protein ACI3KT_16585 [Microbacterium sp. ZW T6_19]|uniref:hypothetical protein n=1 Tax=Microbacterium sp. ZW T6_19 TaxID=3378082 RepID=UPI003851A7D7
MKMTDEQQPELRWAPIEPKPRNSRRMWLIIGLVVAALVVAGVVLFFVLNQNGNPDAEGTASPSPSTSATSTAMPSPSPSGSVEPTTEPTTPVQTEPPVVDPSVEAFRGQVSGWLGDGGRGLDIVAESSGQDALPVIDTLQEDAQRLSDAQPPASILEQWYGGIDAYSQKLKELRSAVSAGSGVSGAVDAARTELASLKALVGL